MRAHMNTYIDTQRGLDNTDMDIFLRICKEIIPTSDTILPTFKYICSNLRLYNTGMHNLSYIDLIVARRKFIDEDVLSLIQMNTCIYSYMHIMHVY